MDDRDSAEPSESTAHGAVSIEGRLLRLEEAITTLHNSLVKSGILSISEAEIRIIDAMAPGKVKIHPDDAEKKIHLAKKTTVIFKNLSSVEAKVYLPVSFFEREHEVKIPFKGKETLKIKMGLTSTDANTECEFRYRVEPSGSGGGPKMIIKP